MQSKLINSFTSKPLVKFHKRFHFENVLFIVKKLVTLSMPRVSVPPDFIAQKYFFTLFVLYFLFPNILVCLSHSITVSSSFLFFLNTLSITLSPL